MKLTGDSSFIDAIDTIWQDVVANKLYITGGIGARHEGEAFGETYQLPNATAYNETCAAIAKINWNQRPFRAHADRWMPGSPSSGCSTCCTASMCCAPGREELVFVPYYAWAHRGVGDMAV
jgi:DUF1680 family protein